MTGTGMITFRVYNPPLLSAALRACGTPMPEDRWVFANPTSGRVLLERTLEPSKHGHERRLIY